MFIKELLSLTEAKELRNVLVKIGFQYEEYEEFDNDDTQYDSGAFLIQCGSATEASNLVKMLKTTKDKLWVNTLCVEIVDLVPLGADIQTIRPSKPIIQQVGNLSLDAVTLTIDKFLNLVELKLS
jgi:hypothetical protein